MKISDYKQAYEDASSKLSEINRNLIYAGFALIWIFKTPDKSLNINLIWGSILLICAAVSDIMQYIITTCIWYSQFRQIEQNERNNLESDFSHSKKLTYPIWTLFWVKIIFNCLAYIFIFIFLIKMLL